MRRKGLAVPLGFPRAAARALARFGLNRPGSDPFPSGDHLRPMLLTVGRESFDDPAWVYEPQWDGFRIVAGVQNGAVRLLSRNLHTLTGRFRPVAEALQGFPTSLVLDGEMVVITEKGIPEFEALHRRLRPQRQRPSGRLAYMVFDCLYVNGHSLLSRPLEERQVILKALQPILSPPVVITEAFPGTQGTLVFRESVRLGLEGVVAKRRQSHYHPGHRTKDWVKIPVRQRDEFVVAGYLAPSHHHLSTLILGQYDRKGSLAYAGLVGIGLPAETRRVLLRELQATGSKRCPFSAVPELRDHFGELRTDLPPQWVKPTVVVEVEYGERTDQGLRHAVLQGVRADKEAQDIIHHSSTRRTSRINWPRGKS